MQIIMACGPLRQHVWYAPSAPNPWAAYTLTIKDETTAIVLIARDNLPFQVPTKYLFFGPWGHHIFPNRDNTNTWQFVSLLDTDVC